MKPEEFVKDLWRIAVEEGLESYRNIYATTMERATDPFYKSALAFYSALNDDQRNILFAIIKQVEIDTTSTVLAVLDGVSSLPGYDGEFRLYADSKMQINGELSDLFLQIDEHSGE